jgi:hypothetical protein
VTDTFLRTLSFLSLLEQGHAPGEEGNSREEDERRERAYEATQDRYAQRLAASVFAKEPRARAVSLSTLLSMLDSPRRAKDSARVAPDERLLKSSLAAVFTELPRELQEGLLDRQWYAVASPAMLPALRRIYEGAAEGKELLAGLALRRLYELSPEEGRRLVLAEMRRRQGPRVSAQLLDVLPDETLPEVDALVAETLAAGGAGGYDDERLLALAERYATAAVAPQLRAQYEARVGAMPCAPQTSLLAYFLRAEPATGAALVDKALASRKDSGCYRSLLTHVGVLRAGPELERAALSSLDDPDPELAADAAKVLGWYGSASARDALLGRFERWQREWAGRENELVARDEREFMTPPAFLETALLRSLAYSPAWLADPPLLERLRGLCVTKSCRREAASILERFGPVVTAYFNSPGGDFSYGSLSQYAVLTWEGLKQKAAQFPKGTAFTWRSDSPGAEREERAFAELKAHLERAGMRLTR